MPDTTAPAYYLAAELDAVTRRLWANKLAKGFNTTDVPLEVALLHAEVSEVFEAWRKGGDVAGELADVLLYTLSLARMLGVDLGEAALTKMAVNERRAYRRMPNGLHVREGGSR